jgi:DNA-binding CsgD family transcriptional regulator
MVVGLSADRKLSVIFTVSRKSPDFTERDRLVLSLFRPHVIAAMRSVKELCRLKTERGLLEKGIEAEGQGAVLIDREGTILGITPQARELMKRYLDASPSEGDHIAGELLAWFMKETASPPDRIERPPFVMEKAESCLSITLVRDAVSGDSILLMGERKAADLLDPAKRHGLTCREAEALQWLAKGKTNLEIGLILGISPKTVEKHLEHTYAKLGVENRGGAIAMVIGKMI